MIYLLLSIGNYQSSMKWKQQQITHTLVLNKIQTLQMATVTPIFPNPDLIAKYKQNSSFNSLMNENKKQYEQKCQQSLYSDLSKVCQKFIHITTQLLNEKNKLNGQKIYSQKKQIVYVFSHFMPSTAAELHKYFLYFITAFPEPKEPFHLIFVNSAQGGKGKSWGYFKANIPQELPMAYLLFMEKLALIRPSLLDKASSMIQFGVQNKFLNNKLEKYDTLKSYYDSIGKKFEEIKKILPEEVLQDEPDTAMIQPIFSSFICFDPNRTSVEVDVEKQIVNSSKLKMTMPTQKIATKQRKKGLQNYPTGELGIPLALQLMIFYFTEIPARCQTQGLFRKCTSIDDERQLISQLEKENYEVLTRISNEIGVASTLKRFLSNLEPPVIPYESYDRLVEDHTLQSIIREVHVLPLIHFMSLMHLLKFLTQHIIPLSKKNLMTLQNVAICFAPCLMKSKQITAKELIYATISVNITKNMLLHFEQIFGDSHKQKRISNKTYRLFRKSSKTNNSPKNPKDLSIQCPQDFLRPVQSILQDEKQSSFQKLSSQSSQILDNNDRQHPKSESYRVNIVKVQMPKSDIYLEKFQQQEQKQMKKHKSYKKLIELSEKQQSGRKSDCDKNEMQQQQQVDDIPNSQGISRLNKLRAHRSRKMNV